MNKEQIAKLLAAEIRNIGAMAYKSALLVVGHGLERSGVKCQQDGSHFNHELDLAEKRIASLIAQL